MNHNFHLKHSQDFFFHPGEMPMCLSVGVHLMHADEENGKSQNIKIKQITFVRFGWDGARVWVRRDEQNHFCSQTDKW